MKFGRIIFKITLTLILFLLIGLIAVSYYAKNEGTLSDNIIFHFMADYLYPFTLPVFMLAGLLAQTGMADFLFFGISILTVSLIYMWIIVWLIRKFEEWKIGSKERE